LPFWERAVATFTEKEVLPTPPLPLLIQMIFGERLAFAVMDDFPLQKAVSVTDTSKGRPLKSLFQHFRNTLRQAQGER
jgi:hypothetical protein